MLLVRQPPLTPCDCTLIPAARRRSPECIHIHTLPINRCREQASAWANQRADVYRCPDKLAIHLSADVVSLLDGDLTRGRSIPDTVGIDNGRVIRGDGDVMEVRTG